MDREIYRAWTIALALSLTFSLGVGPALRGSTVGLEIWIDRSDRVAAFIGQSAAIVGSILSMRFLIVELPKKRPWIIKGLVGLLSTLPLIVLLSATRGILGERISMLNAVVVATIGLLVAGAHISLRSWHAVLPALGALAIGGRVTLLFESGAPWIRALAWASLAASILACLVAIGFGRVQKPMVLVASTMITTDFLMRVCRGSLDPLFSSLLSSAPGWIVPVWMLLPASIIAHFRGGSSRNAGAPLLVLAAVSPLTPLSLLAATNGLLCLLPEAISQSGRHTRTPANPKQN